MKSITKEQLAALIGEGVHTAIRKVGTSAGANRIYHEIDSLDDAEWNKIVSFVADGIIYSTGGGFTIEDNRQDADIGQ